MNALLDHLLVGVVLALGFGYAVYSLGPKSLRTRIRAWAGRPAAKGGTCGGCDNCGSAPPPVTGAPASEIHVPVSKIGKRR